MSVDRGNGQTWEEREGAFLTITWPRFVIDQSLDSSSSFTRYGRTGIWELSLLQPYVLSALEP